MCVTIHIPVLIAIYMYISDKLFIFVKFSWIKLAKFMIKQYYKSIGVKKCKQDVIAFVNTVTQFIHRGSNAHIVTVVRKFS